jgi:peptidoglycan hydrolase FlgJ
MKNLPIELTKAKAGIETGQVKWQPDKLKKACREFESLFVQEMLKMMRKSMVSLASMGDGPEKDIYFSLIDQELSRSLAEKGSLGLGKMIYDRMARRAGKADDSPQSEPGLKMGKEDVHDLSGK